VYNDIVPLYFQTWKSLEATERSLTELINRKDTDVTSLFADENTPPRSPHETDKKKTQRLETEGYYLSVRLRCSL